MDSTNIARAWSLVLLLTPLTACDPEDDAGTDDEFGGGDVEPRGPIVTPTTDTYFGLYQQWHYDAIRLREAWFLTTGSNSVHIAVADSGKLLHSDLVDQWSGGYDFYTGDADATDVGHYHHGIHVAGTIAAARNDDLGVGVCWGCRLMPLRVQQYLPDDPELVPDVKLRLANAIRYAAGLPTGNGRGQTVQSPVRAAAINISMGNLPAPCPADLNSAIDAATSAGTAVVVSAGNGDSGLVGVPNFNTADYLWPSCNNPNLIIVAAVEAEGYLEPYSLEGSAITLSAPGGAAVDKAAGHGELIGDCTDPFDPNTDGTHGVVSTWYPFGTGTPACYRHFAGTSMAAPHVSGVIGLMRSRNPALSVPQIRSILVQTAKTIPCGSICGAGMVDAYEAVKASTFSLSVTCESTGGGGYYCMPSASGGVAPLSATWLGVSNASVGAAYMHSTGQIHGSCTLNTNARVRATFTDAIGRVVVAEDSFICSPIPP